MARPILAALIAFLVATAAGTGIAMSRANAALASQVAPADSSAGGADSTTPAAVSAGDTGDADHADLTGKPGAGDTLLAAATHTPPPIAPRELPAAPTSRPTPVAAIPTVADTTTSERVLRASRLAKLFSAMSPRDAAKVLAQMSDHDVIEILTGLTERRAGEILAVMDPERSASLAGTMLLTPVAPR